jgi:outer membrane protein TolC
MNRLLTAIALLPFVLPAAVSAGEGAAPVLTLDEAIAIAIEHNPRIREAEANKGGATEEIKGTRADFLPRASAQYGYSKLQDEPFQRIGGIPVVIGDDDSHHWDISITQPLFTGFALTSRHQQAKIGAEIAESERQQQLVAVSQDLRIAWFEALLAARMTLVAEDSVKALTGHRDDAAGFFRQGLVSRNDLLKAEVSLANAIQEKERVKAAREIARKRLATIIGIDLPPERQLEDFTSIAPGKLELESLYTEALRNNPILQGIELSLEKYDHSITLARSGYYPTIALNGTYEQNGSDLGASTNDYRNDHNASVTVQANWNFFEWGKTGVNVAKQRYGKQALLERQKATQDEVRLAVSKAYLDLEVAATSIATAEHGRDQARENWRITNLQYGQQVATTTDVLDSRTLLSQAENNYFRALYGYRIALAELDKVLGRK